MLTPPQALEALLFAVGEPLTKKQATALLGITEDELAHATRALSESLADRGITLVESERDLELRTAGEASELVKRLRESEFSRDLGKAGLEALALILYREGATRSEIDWVRGVNSGATVRSLLLRGLVERTEDPTDARKVRYQATTDALAHLGISSPTRLPRYEELSAAVKGLRESEPAETHDHDRLEE